MKVVVTGGAGFIGANLCRQLAEQEWISDVVALDDLSTGFQSNLFGVRCRLVVGSFLNDALLSETLSGASAIVHLGARPSVARSIEDPMATHDSNATGTLKVLQAARALDDPLVIVASSSSVYGANAELPKHELMTPMPMSPYAVSKLAAEQYAVVWQRNYGMRTLPLRFFNVFGPFQTAGHAYAAVIPAFITAALVGEPLTVQGDGRQSRDFTFVETVCDVIVDAVRRSVTSERPVNLAFGTRTTLLGLITMLEGLIGRRVVVDHVEARVGDVRHSQASSDLLRSLVPNVQPVDLRTGLERTVGWMRSQVSEAW